MNTLCSIHFLCLLIGRDEEGDSNMGEDSKIHANSVAGGESCQGCPQS